MWGGKWEQRRGEVPAQFTSDDGEGRDLYACHNKEAAFARLLNIYQEMGTKEMHVMHRLVQSVIE